MIKKLCVSDVPKKLKTQFVMKLLRLRVTDERICALIDDIMICKIWNDFENVFTRYTIFRAGICFTEIRKYLGKPFAIRDLGIQ